MILTILGATGLVGKEIIKILEEKENKAIKKIIFVATEKSKGNKIKYKNKEYNVVTVDQALKQKPTHALFSAGAKASKKYAKEFNKIGAIVIDNSSAFRMKKNIKLIVPEINGKTISKKDKIISNPNCSTIQLIMAIAMIQKKIGIKRIVISTYQSVTGTGVAAVEQMNKEREGQDVEKVYPYPIDLNCFPHGGDFMENGYSSEEMKLVNETRKIFNDPSIQITSTVVRIPVIGGHSEAVNVELHNDFNLDTVKKEIENTPGVVLQDDLKNNLYPMPLTAHEKNEFQTVIVQRRSMHLIKDYKKGEEINIKDVFPLRPSPAGSVQPYEIKKLKKDTKTKIPLPLILTGWWETNMEDKRQRFLEEHRAMGETCASR